ncbi:MAG: hypothetical protein FJW35_01400, partial [Acidobacteria bacterium]|nr:hypothetical protein [Acidobacteriota bacterium]
MRLTVFRAIVSMSMFTVLAFAVTPRFWENFLQEELLEGTLTGISLTWDGRLTPAPTYDRVFDTEQPFIFSMVRDQAGNIYLGTGHSGKIFHVDPQGKGSLYYHAPELDVFALAVDAAGVLYAGTSPDGKVYKITGPEKATEFCDPEDKYIWSLLFDDRGNLLVGTGGRGLVLKVNPKGEKSTFFDPSDANVTCLTRSNDGHILAGTSPGGLVLRIDPEGKAFTLLDTEMEEIRSLATDRFGTVYAVAAGSKGAGAAAPGKGEPPLVPTTGPLPIATIQALSAIGQRAVDSSASVTVPGGGQGSTGARSAIYAISAGGAAETVYTSKDTMIYDVIVETDGSALSSTGDRGRILRIDTERHVTVITDSPEEQITRLAKDAGTVWAAGSNQGRLYKMGAGTASSGSYES